MEVNHSFIRIECGRPVRQGHFGHTVIAASDIPRNTKTLHFTGFVLPKEDTCTDRRPRNWHIKGSGNTGTLTDGNPIHLPDQNFVGRRHTTPAPFASLVNSSTHTGIRSNCLLAHQKEHTEHESASLPASLCLQATRGITEGEEPLWRHSSDELESQNSNG